MLYTGYFVYDDYFVRIMDQMMFCFMSINSTATGIHVIDEIDCSR